MQTILLIICYIVIQKIINKIDIKNNIELFYAIHKKEIERQIKLKEEKENEKTRRDIERIKYNNNVNQ